MTLLAATVGGRELRFNPYPDVILVMGVLVVGYWYVTRRIGPGRDAVTTRRQKVWWYTSVAVLFVFASWPIHPLAEHYSFAVHMAEHEVFVLVAAPMMLLGTPEWMLRWAVVERPWYGVVRWVTRPFPAGVLYALVTIVGHWPALVNETTHNEPFHFAMHAVLYVSGLVFWMPVINRMPEFGRLTSPVKILYLFVTSVPATLPIIMLIFTTHVLYSAYAGAPQYLGWSNKGDQEMAGAIMGMATSVYLWGLVTYLFFAWWAAEQSSALPDDLTWADVERQFGRSGVMPDRPDR